ncbi:helix-turn-helix transcriptional regulator [Flavobacteriaceae bacterium TP-CH-4]|uniref:Helix-turn-helix transcriptional regulator n=1 Tax=Pelagihabitans pacificus TaxID=2696054 RepID=A0A967EBB7_9FLAO|nr:helix-turn-helix transcriptional regulator [Pelagihabitans pacificus]NHF60196.1 helix-turn-helix transcriptional regulator [Pelagihabitans pacificus]
MVNTEDFIRRLEQLLHYYGLSASAFADKVQVQRSSISHLLSGRNKPSLDFVLKVVKTFPEVNLYWLLNGKGSFPAEAKSGESSKAAPAPSVTKSLPQADPSEKTIEKIIIFYSDGSFKSYHGH